MSGGPALSFKECLVTSQVDSTANASLAVATTILPPQAVFFLPSNFFAQAGKMIVIKAKGRISATVSAPTLVMGVWFGTVATPIIVFTSGVITLVARATTNVSWEAEIALTCRTVGSGTSATMMGQGRFTSEVCVGSAANVATNMMLPLSAPAVGTGFDATAVNAVNLFATWGTSSSSNSIQTHQYSLESVN